MGFWFDEERRLSAARFFQLKRLERIARCWTVKRLGDGMLKNESELQKLLGNGKDDVNNARSFKDLLLVEARLSKQLYAQICQVTGYGSFTRVKRGQGHDVANRFLDHGNYLAYGLAATATWILGLPHAFAVMHGKTRRGGLVFDVADLIKDAVVMPEAFLAAMRGDSDQEFRDACISELMQTEALDFLLDTLKEVIQMEGTYS